MTERRARGRDRGGGVQQRKEKKGAEGKEEGRNERQKRGRKRKGTR